MNILKTQKHLPTNSISLWNLVSNRNNKKLRANPSKRTDVPMGVSSLVIWNKAFEETTEKN